MNKLRPVTIGGKGYFHIVAAIAGYSATLLPAIPVGLCASAVQRGQVVPETLTQKREYVSSELMAKKFLGAYEAVLAKPR